MLFIFHMHDLQDVKYW